MCSGHHQTVKIIDKYIGFEDYKDIAGAFGIVVVQTERISSVSGWRFSASAELATATETPFELYQFLRYCLLDRSLVQAVSRISSRFR